MRHLSILAITATLACVAHVSYANPYSAAQTAHAQAAGYYMSQCGGPTPDYCNRGGGGGQYWYGKYGAAATSDATGLTYLSRLGFRKHASYDAPQRVWDDAENKALKHCQRKTGKPCDSVTTYVNTCVAVAAFKVGNEYMGSAVRNYDRCSTAKQEAIAACQSLATRHGYAKEAASCHVIDTMNLL